MKIDYTRIYQKWHSDTPEHWAHMKKYYTRILHEHFPEDPDSEILDVGCGMGFALMALKDAGFRKIVGVDSDQGQVGSCRRKGLEVEKTEDTGAYLRENAGRFSLILALDLVEHIPVSAQLEFINAIYGALKPGGVFLCTVPNANSVLAGRYRYICWTHHSAFTEHSLDFLLFNGGFQDIKVCPVELFEKPAKVWLPVGGARHWWAFKLVRFFRRLQMMAELGPQQGRGVPLSLNIMGIAGKS